MADAKNGGMYDEDYEKGRSRKKPARGSGPADDGRTVADMSGVPQGMLHGLSGRFGEPARGKRKEFQEIPEQPERPWEETALTKKEQWMCALGALKAALLIAAAFLIGLGAVILAMIFLWT